MKVVALDSLQIIATCPSAEAEMTAVANLEVMPGAADNRSIADCRFRAVRRERLAAQLAD